MVYFLPWHRDRKVSDTRVTVTGEQGAHIPDGGLGHLDGDTPLNHCGGATVRPGQQLSWAEAPESPQSMTYLEKNLIMRDPKLYWFFPL